MMELEFRYRHDCPFTKLSQRHPDVLFAHWCNHDHEILEAQHTDEEALRAFHEDVRGLSEHPPRVLHDAGSSSGTLRLLLECVCRTGPSTEDRIEKNGGIPLRPILYKEGWEHYRVIATEDNASARILGELQRHGEVEVKAKRRSAAPLWKPGYLLAIDDLLGPLTAKQLTVLASALAAGYYRVPRAVKSEDLAKRAGTPRTTFEEHLRKAENKVLASIAPYVEILAQAADARSPRAAKEGRVSATRRPPGGARRVRAGARS